MFDFVLVKSMASKKIKMKKSMDKKERPESTLFWKAYREHLGAEAAHRNFLLVLNYLNKLRDNPCLFERMPFYLL
ncbi:MAG: hypothetical protein GX116_03640 [Fibrobacter sp.]|nr:hypothetical protein [Fibrobacter sp.]